MAFTITGVLPATIDPQQRQRTVHYHGGKLTGDGLVRYHLVKSGHAAAVCRDGCQAPDSPWCLYLGLTLLLESYEFSGTMPRGTRCLLPGRL